WVRENISALSGDSRNVTAFGQSAGSISLHHHMVIPAHYGLFDHAILQSGAIGALPTGTVEQDGQPIFDRLLETFGIPSDLSGQEKVKRLRAVPMDELTKAGESVMIGANKDEGFGFDASFGERNLTTWSTLLKTFAPAPHLEVLFKSAYGVPKTDEDVLKIVAQYPGDLIFQYPIERAVNALIEVCKDRDGRFRLERYHFDVETEQSSLVMPGCGSIHGGELLFVFGPPMTEDVLNKSELAASLEAQKRWIAFANQRPVHADDGQKVAKVGEGQAIVWTNDYKVEVGESRRLGDSVKAFWNAAFELKLKRIQEGPLGHRLEE
ncbi:hypothetical protein BGX29_001702, partial [Mortierella sp. GBA35]